MAELCCDVLVVGGGINGAGIARDAAGRGLDVVLCERDDLAAHTSSASTKLIHGGLRYLEYYEFGLVRKALIERELLLRNAPHLIRPQRFIMPHHPALRAAWMIRAGLFLYDHLARRELLPASGGVDLRRHRAGAALQPQYTRAFAYSDATVDDARLVLANALDAAERGARVFTRTACGTVQRQADGWHAVLRHADGNTRQVRARCLVNACGPWAASFLHGVLPGHAGAPLRLVKGSHIVVRQLFEHSDAYIFQHGDGRVVFAIPYQGAFTLIGTTELDFSGDPGQVVITSAEVDYLCALANRYFVRQIGAADVVWSFAGVRPLLDADGSDGQGGRATGVTRDYRLEFDDGGAPLLSVLGGKITTYRILAEQAVDQIQQRLGGGRPAWSATACLPGGDWPGRPAKPDFAALARYVAQLYPWLPAPLVQRYAGAYGSRVRQVLDGCRALADLGEEVVPGLYARELDYLIVHEWARCAEDVLWRRTHLGLQVSAAAALTLERWMQRRLDAT